MLDPSAPVECAALPQMPERIVHQCVPPLVKAALTSIHGGYMKMSSP